MSHAGAYFKTGMALLNKLEEGKPHTSVTDWIEVLSSDRYDELSLDGIPELVESVNIQGSSGTQEASRAIRKKLKYGNVHRQLRALVILRALTENASKGFQLNWANEMLMDRLKTMAGDSLLDPKVKKRMLLVFHAWSIQYADEPRMREVAKLYSNYSGAPSRRGSTQPGAYASTHNSPTTPTAPRSRNTFTETDNLYSHSWEPAPGQRGADTYADLAQAKADAESRRAARDRQIAIEQREAELERREREQRRKQDMAALESRRQKDMLEEQERRRKMKEEQKRGPTAQQKQVKKFDLQKEKPNIMVAVASALQAANVLVNSMRHINREYENVQESPKVQENLDKAKAARRSVIRYIQLVQDEELVGTLLEANEKVVEAIQMYDRMSKPAVLDSDSEHERERERDPAKRAETAPTEREIDALTRRMEAQRLEALRTGELQKLQDRQKRESAREKQRREEGRPSRYEEQYGSSARQRQNVHSDLADLDFGSSIGQSTGGGGSKLPPPLSPDSERGSFDAGNLSDFSNNDRYDYDSSDDDYRASRSRRQSQAAGASGGYGAGRGGGNINTSQAQQSSSSRSQPQSPRSPQSGNARRPQQPLQNQYTNLRDDDPFADEFDTPVQENRRMQWTEI